MSDSKWGKAEPLPLRITTHIEISIVTHLMALANYALCIIHCAL
jgi:hypothetical protein